MTEPANHNSASINSEGFQNTPIVPRSHWTDTIAQRNWLVVGQADSRSPNTWNADMLELFSLAHRADGDDEQSQLDLPPGTDTDQDLVARLSRFNALLDDHEILLAYMGIGRRWPIPVVVSFLSNTLSDEELMAIAGAHDTNCIEHPEVEARTDHAGDVVKVTRFTLNDDLSVQATVCCAGRGRGYSALLTWSTTELDLITRLTSEIDFVYEVLRVGLSYE